MKNKNANRIFSGRWLKATRAVFAGVLGMTVMLGSLNAQTQQKRWILQNQSIDFTSGTPVVQNGLPNYTVPFGSPVSNGMHDASGNLLFYMNHEMVINKYGTSIGLPNNSFWPLFASEICVVPVPGSTCQYYLIYETVTHGGNVFCPGVGDRYNTNYATVDMTLNSNNGGLSNFGIEFESCTHVSGGQLAVGPLVASGTKRYLYKAGFNPCGMDILKFEVTATGIGAQTTVYTDYPVPCTGFDVNAAELDLSHDGSMLAFANQETGSTTTDVMIFHLDPSTGNLLPTAGNQGNGTSIFSIPGSNNKFTGIEFSPNGANLFVGQENIGIHHIDVTTGSLITTFSGSSSYGNSQIELAYDPAGNNSIYIANATSMARIDNPNSSPTFVSGAIPSGITANQGAAGNNVYQLPDQLDGYNYDDAFTGITPQCCASVNTYDKFTFSAPASATWTAGSNPFNPSGTVLIRNELRIPTGKNVTIQNMTFKFEDGAKVIIEKNAKLTLDGTTFTSTDCGVMWQGIEMWGVKTSSQLPLSNSPQPYLIIKNNSLIENAREAIRVWNPGDFNSTGGIVQATSSTFRNNWRCAEFISYQNFNPSNNNPLSNQSYFRRCTFETTTDYLNDGVTTPYSFLTFWDVWRINLQGNTYRNTSIQADKALRGRGIVAIDARLNINYHCSSFFFPCPAANKTISKFEDLYYGVDLASSNPINTSTINECEFTNNFRGTLLRGMDFATVTLNKYVIDVPYMSMSSYGLYTDNCSAYKIEGNDFTTLSSGTIGTFTWLSGTSPNRIYRNTFSDVVVGSIASEDNSGLQYRCNQYSNIVNSDIANTYKDIYLFQGWCDVVTDDPADNTFSYGAGFDLYKNPPSFPFVYFHHTGTPYDPATLTPGIAKSDCLHSFDANVHCKPTTGIIKTRAQMFAENAAWKTEIADLNDLMADLIDGGNTQDLLNLINTGSEGNIKNGLLNASPYLSDDVLLAYINSNPPAGHLNQVILANSPVSNEIMQALLNSNLPSGVMNIINNAQTGISERQILEGRLDYFKQNAWLTIDDIIRDYLNDTIIENPLDSVALVLKFERREISKCQYIATLIAQNELIDAEDEITLHKQEHGGVLDNYCKLLEILLDLKKAGESCAALPPDKEVRAREIADETDKNGCAQAQTLLKLAFFEHFEETIILPGEAPENRIAFFENITTSSQGKLKVYPNPFNNSVTLEFFNMNIPNTEITIMDIYGRIVKTINISEGTTSTTIDLSNQGQGVYFYKVVQFGKTVESGKIIKTNE